MTPKINHSEIWLANFNAPDSDPAQPRPVLVVQNQALLEAEHPSTLVIPLTPNLIEQAEPLRLRIKAQQSLDQDYDLLIDQIRAIDNKRLIKGPLARCSDAFMATVYEAIQEIMGII